MPSSLLLNVSPQIALVTNIPGPCEVVELLELVEVLKFGRTDQPSPEAVP